MKAFRALLRVSLTALLRSIAPGRGGAALALGLSGSLSLLLSLLFGGLLSAALVPLGAPALVPAFLCLVGGVMAFLFTVVGAGGLLFGGRDNDLLLALPVPDSVLLAGRLSALYLENLLLFGLTLVPGMVLCCAISGWWLPVLLSVPVALLGALLPTLLAALLGWAIAWLTSHARHNALLGNLAYGAVLLGALALSVAVNLSTRTAAVETESLARALSAVFEGPLWLFGRMGAACTGDAAAFAWVLLFSLCPAALFVWGLGRGYRRLLTRMSAHRAARVYRMTAQRCASPMAALLRKEAARFFHTPVYLFNAAFGVFLLAAATVFACWQGDALLAWLGAETGLALSSADLYGAFVGIACLMLATVSTSSVSLSLEGRALWLVKSLPVPARRLLWSKVWFNMLVGWPLTALFFVLLWLTHGFTLLQGLAFLLVSAALSAVVSLGGTAVNLRFPRLDAANDTVVCKQSLSAMLGIFGGMALALAGIAGCLLVGARLPLAVYLLACGALLTVLAAALGIWLDRAGPRYLQKL